ncbi:MAG: ETC complex I subunit [Rickettsiales bacterium]|nr:ETC complex I subunit [Rickettsiales bacterium]
MTVTIYKPSATAMQSGRKKTKKWLLEYPVGQKHNDSLMGWPGSKDATQNIKLFFETKEQAIYFAQKQKLDFQIIEPHLAKPSIRKYEDNFK